MTWWPLAAGAVGIVTFAVIARDRSGHATDRAFGLLLVAAQLMSPLGWIYYQWLPAGPIAATIRSGSGCDDRQGMPFPARGVSAGTLGAGPSP